MKKIWLFLPLLIFSSGFISATDSNLKDQLRKTYAGSPQLLRHFYAAANLKFDFNGNSANKESEGSWTLLSGVLIDNVTLKAEKLEFHGHRRMLLIDDQKKTLRSIKLGQKFSIEIKTHSGPDQARQLTDALARVFVSPDDLVSAVPDYWRDYLARFSGKAAQGESCEDSAVKLVPDDGSSRKVFARITDAVKIHDVPPTYFAIARKNRVEGELALQAVIDTSGL